MNRPSPATSSNTSPQSSDAGPTVYLPAPSVGSSGHYGRSSRTSSPYSVRQGDSPEYISPYPPLPPTTAPSAARPITAITPLQAPHSSSRSSSAVSTTSPLAGGDDNAQKQAMIKALNEHRINTIVELRRVERIFANLGSSDVTQPMTSAWMYYVNSNSLLTELRGLTKHYPFSSECLEEAKRRVHQDPASNRSWNYCWLVLAKIHTDKLIQTYAKAQASRPEMWGGRIPLAESVDQLAKAFVDEWTAALAQLLKYWETAPIR